MIRIERHGDVERIVFSTRRSRTFGYSVSAYAVRGVLVDTGFPGVAREIGRLLDRLRPRGVVLTHQHEDHAGNLRAVAARGLPLAASPLTLDAVREGERAGAYRRMVWGTLEPFGEAFEPFEPRGLTLIHAPGHSVDHHVVWDEERRTLFAADLFLAVKVRNIRPMESPREHVRSLRAAAALRPRVMFDAHRGLVPDPIGALEAKADWMEATIAAIDARTAEGWDEAAITRAVLGAEDWIGRFSLGDLSRRNFVRVVRATSEAVAPPSAPPPLQAR